MPPLRNHTGVLMTVSLTIKNVPDDTYKRLKIAAAANHRSMNGEAIHRLAQSLLMPVIPADEHAARARLLREGIGKSEAAKIQNTDVVKIIRASRDRR